LHDPKTNTNSIHFIDKSLGQERPYSPQPGFFFQIRVLPRCAERTFPVPFNNYRVNYDAETLAILPAALDELGLC
jgi:hypothetical protein